MTDISQHNLIFKGSNSEYGVPLDIILKSVANVTYKPVFDFLTGKETPEEDIDVEKIPQMIDGIMMREAMTLRDYNQAEPPVGKKFDIVI